MTTPFYPGAPPTRLLSWNQLVREADPNFTRDSIQPWVFSFSNGRRFIDYLPLYGDYGTLLNVEGVLHVLGGDWPESSAGLPPGALWSDDGVVTVVLPIIEDPVAPIYFGQVTAPQLLFRGGNNLPLGSGGTALLEIWVTPGTGVLRVATEPSMPTFIGVNTPDWGTVPGDPLTISGTYTGGTPTAFQYALDGGAFIDAPAATIGSGVWSFVITAPASGVHYIAVTAA